MVQSMAAKPIIFALANPDPEIHPETAKKVCPDAVIATGRVDFPNQVNNVLGFPSIFRAALDVRATTINQEMKIAAVHALAELARESVPESVSLAYGGDSFHFGPEYILPKPFDPRVVIKTAPKVAEAAMKSHVARHPISDLSQYQLRLSAIHGAKQLFVKKIIRRIKRQKAVTQLPKIIFPEGLSQRILKAINSTVKENLYQPVLLGPKEDIQNLILEMKLDHLGSAEIINPAESEKFSLYADTFHQMKKRQGVLKKEAQRLMSDANYFAAMSVHLSHGDGMVTGASQNYVDSIRPVLQIIGCPPNMRPACGMNIVLIKDKVFIFGDTTVNIDPSAEQIAMIASHALNLAGLLHIEPRIAMLSFSNFTGRQASPKKMKQAVDIFRKKHPKVPVDGEMQADTAVNPKIIKKIFPFSNLHQGANILIFPNLDSGNIAYKLVQQLGSGEVIGPLLMGMDRPVDIVQRTGTIDDVINTILFTLLKIQAFQKTSKN